MIIFLWLLACATEVEPALEVTPVPGNGPAQPGHQTPGLAPVGTGVFTAAAPEKQTSPSKTASCLGCDVYIISVCSLRKDHVGAYGYEINTPSMDRIASGGTRFRRAYSASNFTLAGLTAILTGRFASSTGVTGWDKGLTSKVPTIPEVLGHYGYTTGAFSTDSASGFRPDYGLDRGFQSMTIDMPAPGTADGRHIGGAYSAGQMARPMAKWLAQQDDNKPVFVMIHTRTAHYPFVGDDSGVEADETGTTRMLWEAGRPREPAAGEQAPGPGNAGGVAQHGVVPMAGPDPIHTHVSEVGAPAIVVWKQRYAEAVEKMDADVGVVLAAIKARGRWDRSIIVLLGDHGESLNDHSELLHGDAFFDSVINVPLLIKMPGMKPGQSTNALVSHVDVLPTILESVGAVQPAGIDGVSLLPVLSSPASSVRNMVLSEGGVARHDGDSLPGAVIAPPWTLLKQRGGCGVGLAPIQPDGGMPLCLFNLQADPHQLHSVADAHPDVVSDLLQHWSDFRAATQGDSHAELKLSDAFVQELRDNGYDFNKSIP
jgi:arylsulfatase A-like enzyme